MKIPKIPKKLANRVAPLIAQCHKDGYFKFYSHTMGKMYRLSAEGFLIHAVEFYMDLCAPIQSTPQERIMMGNDSWIFECPSCGHMYNLSPHAHVIEPNMLSLRVCDTDRQRLPPFTNKDRHIRRWEKHRMASFEYPDDRPDDDQNGIDQTD